MFEFRKANRLLKRLEFKDVFNGGSKVVRRHLVVLGQKVEHESRIGLVVSKKVGNAVVRNKVKRRLRESFRLLLPNLPSEPGLDLVVIARHTAAKASFQEISDDLQTCIKRIQKKLEL